MNVKMKCYRSFGGGGLASVLDVQSFFFFIKGNWICAMTTHHAHNILLIRNLPFDSDVRPVKPSFDDTIERVVNLNMTCFILLLLLLLLVLFDFVH